MVWYSINLCNLQSTSLITILSHQYEKNMALTLQGHWVIIYILCQESFFYRTSGKHIAAPL